MLAEDEGFGDITSDAVVEKGKEITAKIISKDEGILAGMDIIREVFEEYGIPSLLYSATSFASSNEIYVIKNILALINKKRLNNPDIRYNFISIARSYLFDYQEPYL